MSSPVLRCPEAFPEAFAEARASLHTPSPGVAAASEAPGPPLGVAWATSKGLIRAFRRAS
ncbi:predicted protein [Streptomyces albidoflavus]|nr:predicted protein [Streptomyces albidoflavus]